MKAITLTQPWATGVAIELKRWETRSWRTDYRGLLAIHAAKGYPPYAREFAAEQIERWSALPIGFPLGAVVCVVKLLGCWPTQAIAPKLPPVEREWGDYTPGRWAWQLELIEVLPEPIPAKGALGLWEWSDR